MSATRCRPASTHGRRPPQELRHPRRGDRRSRACSVQVVDLGDLTVGRMVNEPGWRWSTHMRPSRRRRVVPGSPRRDSSSPGVSGSSSPTARRSSSARATSSTFRPATTATRSATSPCVQVEWTGLRHGPDSRRGSTAAFWRRCSSPTSSTRPRLAARLGDAPGGAALGATSRRSRRARALRRAGGRHDRRRDARDVRRARRGRCTARRRSGRPRSVDGLQIRIGVHVGEVELVGEDVRGVDRARGGAHHGCGRPGGDPRLRADACLAGAVGARVRGSRHARAQGPRRRVAPVRLRASER